MEHILTVENSEKEKLIQRKLEHDRTAGGFIGGRYSVKWYQQFFTKTLPYKLVNKLCRFLP